MVGSNETDNDYYLGWSILDFFINNPNKSVLDFYQMLHNNYGRVGVEETNLNRIIEELCKRNYLKKVNGTNDLNSRYVGAQCDLMKYPKNIAANTINCFCFGFEYIYNAYRDNIKIIRGTIDDVPVSGTCFVCGDRIYTAGHCIKNLCNIEIDGFSKEELKNARTFITEYGDLDIGYIEIDVSRFRHAWFSELSYCRKSEYIKYRKNENDSDKRSSCIN